MCESVKRSELLGKRLHPIDNSIFINLRLIKYILCKEDTSISLFIYLIQLSMQTDCDRIRTKCAVSQISGSSISKIISRLFCEGKHYKIEHISEATSQCCRSLIVNNLSIDTLFDSSLTFESILDIALHCPKYHDRETKSERESNRCITKNEYFLTAITLSDKFRELPSWTYQRISFLVRNLQLFEKRSDVPRLSL